MLRRHKNLAVVLLVCLFFYMTDSIKEEKVASEYGQSGYDYMTVFQAEQLPAYDGASVVMVNNGTPYFTEEDLQAAELQTTETQTVESWESYSDLDRLGRCGMAYACIGRDLMPEEERGEIDEVIPSGWENRRYDFIDQKFLYNRCHLIGYQLTGENANEKNLITGTRYMNIEGMLPYESKAASYIRRTGNHVLYRATPIFEGNNLVASGVLLEAASVEDGGYDLSFCVYAYNVQPGVTIDYGDGANWLAA